MSPGADAGTLADSSADARAAVEAGGRDATAPPPDGRQPPDAANMDVVLPPLDVTITPPPDVPVLLPDGMTLPPDTRPVDPVFPDAGPDAPPAPPPELALEGRWRQVALDFPMEDGRRAVLTDRDQPLDVGGGVQFQARINGTLVIEARRFSLFGAVIVNGHIGARDEATDAEDGLSMHGAVVPGLLMGSRFVVGMNTFEFMPDASGNVLTTVDRDSGTRNVYQRVEGLRAGTPYEPAGVAGFIGPAHGTRIANLRFAVAWDVPGSPTPEFESTSVLGRANAFNGVNFSLPLGAPPMRARARIGSATASVAYFLAFEDSNGNARYDDGTDPLRGLSQLAYATIDRTDDPLVLDSHFRLLAPGGSMCVVAVDYSRSSSTLIPFDGPQPHGPDVALSATPIANLFPDMLR